MRGLFIVTLPAVLLAACATTEPPPRLEGAQDTVSALAAAFSACDLGKLASLYAETAEFVAPDTPQPVTGRAAIAKHLSGACTATYQPTMKVLAQRAQALGRYGAVVTGSYAIGRSDQAHSAPWVGAFVITLVRAQGGWLIQTQGTFAGP